MSNDCLHFPQYCCSSSVRESSNFIEPGFAGSKVTNASLAIAALLVDVQNEETLGRLLLWKWSVPELIAGAITTFLRFHEDSSHRSITSIVSPAKTQRRTSERSLVPECNVSSLATHNLQPAKLTDKNSQATAAS